MKALYLMLIKNIFWKLQSILFLFKPLQIKIQIAQGDFWKIYELEPSHSSELSILLLNASSKDLGYFNPHKFTSTKFKNLLFANNYKAWGVFSKQQLIGYGFVRCTFWGNAYAGYFIHPNFRKQGLSKKLFQILKSFSRSNNLNLFTTVSPQNYPSLKVSNKFKKVGVRSNGNWILKHEL